MFDAVDDDRSGFLEEGEGRVFLSVVGCAEEELDYYWKDLLRVADENGDGVLSKDEFLSYILEGEQLDCTTGFFCDDERRQELAAQLLVLSPDYDDTAAAALAAEAAALREAKTARQKKLAQQARTPPSTPRAATSDPSELRLEPADASVKKNRKLGFLSGARALAVSLATRPPCAVYLSQIGDCVCVCVCVCVCNA
eukprot:COSAG05_NODE_23_length_31591_cov_92.542995_22_plen_197_part_00